MAQDVYIVNAFVKNGKGGNPAGVVWPADHLSEDEMQKTASVVGISEIAFVSQSPLAEYKLDFFTPNRRIAHCGHATVAAFSFLVSQGQITGGASSIETVDGVRDIRVRDGLVYLQQAAPTFEPVPKDGAFDDILDSLGLSSEDLLPNGEPCVVDTGNRFLNIGVKNAERLAAIVPNQPAIYALSEALSLIGYYVFALEENRRQPLATTRMFAPFYGIDEEAATGMAAGTLAGFLRKNFSVNTNRMEIEQGVFMSPPSPSLLQAELDEVGGNLRAIWVGGLGQVKNMVKVN